MTAGFLTFAIISGLGWLIDVGVTMGLVQFGMTPFIASFAGAAIAVSFVYVVSRLVVFQINQLGSVTDYTIYVVWQIFAITVASFLVAMIGGVLAPHVGALALATGVGKVLVTPLTLAANYLFMRWLTQRRRTPGEQVTTGDPS